MIRHEHIFGDLESPTVGAPAIFVHPKAEGLFGFRRSPRSTAVKSGDRDPRPEPARSHH